MTRQWRARLSTAGMGRAIRSDSSAWRVLDLLPSHLVLTAELVARELQQTPKAANSALRRLVEAGVLVEHGALQPRGKGRPARLYVSRELLALTGSNPLR